MKPVFASAAALFFGAASAAMACPNASTSVTIPLTGSTIVTMYDQSCNVLPGAGFSVGVPGLGLNSTTAPAFVGLPAGLQFSANGAAPGKSGTMQITYLPDGKSYSLTFVVGAPVTGLSAGTTTP